MKPPTRVGAPRHQTEGPDVASPAGANEPTSDLGTGQPPGGRAPAATLRPLRPRLIYRHSIVVRVTHWINVVCLTVLLMSGLQIFNAHPALYWGNLSNFSHPI